MIKPFSVPKIWVPTQFHELGATSDDRVNLAGCENCRVSEQALEAIRTPDPEWLRDHWLAQDELLRRNLGDFHHVDSAQVFLTSGAIGGIRYAFELFVRQDTHVGLLRPEWPGFLFYAEHNRARISYLDRGAFPFTFRPGDLIDFVRSTSVDFMIISNPSAVTGNLWEPAEVAEVLRSCPDTFFVIDEADAIYPHLSAAHLVDEFANGVFLSSFSKFYGLSGLRIGYLVTPAAYAEHFENTVNPAELASVAIVAARKAFTDIAYHEQTQRTVQDNLARVLDAVDGSAFQVVPGSRCFAAYIWSDGSEQDPVDYLARRGIDLVAGPMFGIDRGGRFNLSNSVGIDALVGALVNPDVANDRVAATTS